MATATADLIIRNGTIVSPDAVIVGERRHQGRTHACRRRRRRDAAGEARRSTRPACTCCPAPSMSTCISAIRAIRTRRTWASGTAAAAFGGVTTVFDMPNTIPPTGTAEMLAAKHAIAADKAHVDFGLYGLLGEDTIAHVPDLVAGGVIGFKLYMGNTFGKIPSPSTGAMLEAFEVVAADRQAHFAPRRDEFDHGAARRSG